MIELNNTTYTKYLSEFDTYIEASMSTKSGNSYTAHVRDFLIYLEQCNINQLRYTTTKTIMDYVEMLLVKPKKRGMGIISKRYINHILYSLRLFSKRMLSGGHINRSLPITSNFQLADEDKPELEIANRKEIKQIYDTANTVLEQTLIALSYGNGIRRIGMVNLTDRDINFNKKTITILTKYSKTRTIPISDFFIEVLKQYSLWRLKTLHKTGKRTNAFLIDETGRSISGDEMNTRLKEIIKRTSDETLINKNLTLHRLRASITVHLVDAGYSFQYVKNYLGHAEFDTTALYAKRRLIKNYYTV